MDSSLLEHEAADVNSDKYSGAECYISPPMPFPPPIRRRPESYPCPRRESHNCSKTFSTPSHASRHSKMHLQDVASRLPSPEPLMPTDVSPELAGRLTANALREYQMPIGHNIGFDSQPQTTTVNNSSLQDWQLQPTLSEEPNKKRCLNSQQPETQHNTAAGTHTLQEYQMQLMLLEQQNKKTRLMSSQPLVHSSAPYSWAIGSAFKSSDVGVAAGSGFLPTPPGSRNLSPRGPSVGAVSQPNQAITLSNYATHKNSHVLSPPQQETLHWLPNTQRKEEQNEEKITLEESPVYNTYLATVGSIHSPGDALQVHSAALQHESSVQKIALASLQIEHDKLLAAFSRSQTRASALEKKHKVSDAEITSLTVEKIRLQSQVVELEKNVEQLRYSRDKCRESAVQNGEQYFKLLQQHNLLLELQDGSLMAFGNRDQEFLRETPPSSSTDDLLTKDKRLSGFVNGSLFRATNVLSKVDCHLSPKPESPKLKSFQTRQIEVGSIGNPLGSKSTESAYSSSTHDEVIVHCDTTLRSSEGLKETQGNEHGQVEAQKIPADDGSARDDSPSSFTEDDTDWGEDEDTSALDFQFVDLFALSERKSSSQDETIITLTRPVFSPMKQGIIDRIMKEFWLIWDGGSGSIRNSAVGSPVAALIESVGDPSVNSCEPSDEGKDSSQRSSSESINFEAGPNQRSEKNSIRKRGRDDEDDPEQSPEDNRTPKRSKKSPSPSGTPEKSLKFACPFRKHDPRKYCVRHWRSCALTPLDDVARVKGHLYRHHRIFPCRRCKELFKDQDAVNSHLERSEACELRTIEVADGVTADMVDKLRNKRTGQRTEKQRWEDIYKLLFPYALIPSPYFEDIEENLTLSPDSRDLADYEAYCRRELPLVFRAALEERIQNESQPIEESIRNQLMEIIRDCQDQVSSRYRSSTGTSSGRPSQTPTSSQSPTIARDGRNDLILNTDGTSQVLPIAPFFQPPPPQNHLQSRLDISDIQDSALKPQERHDQSDSGYGSHERETELGSLFSSQNTSNHSSLPPYQPQHPPEPIPTARQNTWNTEAGMLETSSGSGVMDQNGTFGNLLDSSFNDRFEDSFNSAWYDSQSASGMTWDPNMENLFP